jgi:hypothetical protein
MTIRISRNNPFVRGGHDFPDVVPITWMLPAPPG